MKAAWLALALSSLLVGFPAWAQTTEPVEDFKPAPSNQAGKQYPQVNSEGRARFRIVASPAQSVRCSLNRGMALTKDEDGTWVGTPRPLDEGFHYYSRLDASHCRRAKGMVTVALVTCRTWSTPPVRRTSVKGTGLTG